MKQKKQHYFIGYTLNGKDYGIFSYYGAVGVSENMCAVFGSNKDVSAFYAKAVKMAAGKPCENIVKNEFKGGKVWIRKLNSSSHKFVFSKEINIDKFSPRVPFKLKL